jgi:succinate dehydrogenase / fumarate reductase cytochrome b subunit
LRSSIGLKVVMAVTGLGLWAYLIAHMLGNLQIFASDPGVFNGYAEFLKSSAPLLWTERVLVFGAMGVHAFVAIKLTRENAAARPNDYFERKVESSTLMSRTMIVSGLLVLAFFAYHILHFTAHAVGGALFEMERVVGGSGSHLRPNAYLMVHSAFKTPWIVALYVVGQIMLFGHLLHGSRSLFQSIGAFRIFRSPVYGPIAAVIVIGVFAGFISIPLVIYFAWPSVGGSP